MRVIGIDPGVPGAAVVLDDLGAVDLVVTWRKCTRGYRLDHYSALGREVVAGVDVTGWRETVDVLPGRPSALGAYLAGLLSAAPPVAVAVEDVWLGRNLKTTVSLARHGTGTAAALEELAGVAAVYVQASTWRAGVLGLRRGTRREQCKAAALRYMPSLCRGLDLAYAAVGELDHVADAAGIALWMQREIRRRER